MSSQNFPIDIAADQITSTTTSTVKTATVTTTSTSQVSQTKTASTTIATTTTYLNRTRTTTASTTIATTTTYLDRTRTTTASTTVATTTSTLNRTATTTTSKTVATTTASVSRTATTTAPTTVATTTSYVNRTATATTSSTLSTTTTAHVNSTQTVTATSTTTATTFTTTTVPSTPTGLLIPLFIYPTTVSTWSSIAALPAAYPNVPVIAIVNPDSGPGSSQDPNYVAGINSLKAAGVVTIGYVWTNYGGVSLQSVESSIDAWKNLYGVTGIFLDAMAYHTGYESYYQSIVSYAKGTDGMSIVIGNPGTDTIA